MLNFTSIRRIFLFTLLIISPVLTSNLSFAGKLDENLASLVASGQAGAYQVLVTFKKQSDVTKLQKDLQRAGGFQSLTQRTIRMMAAESRTSRGNFDNIVSKLESQGRASGVKRFWIVNAASMRVNLNAVQVLMQHPEVATVELDEERRFIPEDPTGTPGEYSPSDETPWGLTHIGSRKANELGHLGEGVVVAVVDTGIAYKHPAFAPGQILMEKSRSFIPGESFEDRNGHGSHCAGTIGTRQYGVAPGVKIFSERVLDANGSGTFSAIIEGIEDAVAKGADVISMSLGGPDGMGSAVETAVYNGEKAGVFFSIAAGNSGHRRPSIGTPGCVKTALTLGAIDITGALTDFSSGGPTIHGWSKPDVCAPGRDVLSVWLDGKTIKISGTSMATPHAAGLAALVISKWRKEAKRLAKTSEEYAKLAPKPADVKRVIMMTAKGEKEPNTYGEGTIDCVAALEQDPSKGRLLWNTKIWLRGLF